MWAIAPGVNAHVRYFLSLATTLVLLNNHGCGPSDDPRTSATRLITSERRRAEGGRPRADEPGFMREFP